MTLVPKYTTRLQFFDRKVKQHIDPKKKRFLSRVGAFTRTAAQRSLRSGGPPSPPGRPPKSRTGDLKRFVFFFLDSQRESVVIGPVILPGKDEVGGTPQPGALEHGAFRNNGNRLLARPFMRPAFARTLEKLEGLLKEF